MIAYEGEMFAAPRRTGTEFALKDVSLDLPCRPGKFIALWNNYHAQAAKQNLAIPAEPLYFDQDAQQLLARTNIPFRNQSATMGGWFMRASWAS